MSECFTEKIHQCIWITAVCGLTFFGGNNQILESWRRYWRCKLNFFEFFIMKGQDQCEILPQTRAPSNSYHELFRHVHTKSILIAWMIHTVPLKQQQSRVKQKITRLACTQFGKWCFKYLVFAFLLIASQSPPKCRLLFFFYLCRSIFDWLCFGCQFNVKWKSILFNFSDGFPRFSIRPFESTSLKTFSFFHPNFIFFVKTCFAKN